MKVGLIFALIIAVTGQVLYHVTQKSVASGAHPVVSLIVFYLVAALATMPLFFLFPVEGGLNAELGKLNWAVIGVALSIVLIEIGFLLAYRAGGELGYTSALRYSVGEWVPAEGTVESSGRAAFGLLIREYGPIRSVRGFLAYLVHVQGLERSIMDEDQPCMTQKSMRLPPS